VFFGRSTRLAGVVVAAGGIFFCAEVATGVQTEIPILPPIEIEVSTQSVRVSPRALPAKRLAPASFVGQGRIVTADGSFPPALRKAIVDVDKDVRIDAHGLPACGHKRLSASDGEEARQACRESLVGTGSVRISLMYPGSGPATIESALAIFNGGVRDGVTTLFVHAFASLPTPRALVGKVEVTKRGSGLQALVDVPRIAGGLGSLVGFNLKVRRTYSQRGERKSLLTAKCPDDVFRLDTSRAELRNETNVSGKPARTVMSEALLLPCTARG